MMNLFKSRMQVPPIQLQVSIAMIGLPLSFKFALKRLELYRCFMAVGITLALASIGLIFTIDLKN